MTLMSALRVHVKTSRATRYERAVARLAAAARADAKAFEWRASISQGVDGLSYSFVGLAASFVELSGREPIPVLARRLLGESAGDALLEELGAGATSSFSVRRVRDDLSTVSLPLKQAPVLLYLTRLQVRTGGQPAIETLIRSVTDATLKLGTPRKVSVSTTVIGDGGEYLIARPIQDPAELDQMKTPGELLIEAFGEKEGGAILAQAAPVLERVTTSLATPRPDLSNTR
jgi:hypothetical protein